MGSSLAGYWLQFFGARHPDLPARIILASTFRDAGELTGHPLFDVAALSQIDGTILKRKWLSMLHQQSPTVLRELQLRLLEHGQDGELLRLRLMAAASATVAPRMALLPEDIAIITCEDDPLLGTATRNRLLGTYTDARRRARRDNCPVGG